MADNYNNISSEPIDFNIIRQAFDDRAGAVVLFSGNVRNHSFGRQVKYLDYEAYESMASKLIDEIVNEAIEKFDLYKAVCVHRVGPVKLGDAAIIIATASAHRKEAYEANKYIIDRVKHESPIWKKEFFEDGTSEWSHNCSCHAHPEPIVISQ